MTFSVNAFNPGRLVGAAAWLLLAACALAVIRIGIVLVDGVAIEFQPIPVVPEATSPPAPASETAWRMFGRPAAPDHGLDRPLPATPLALRLRGAVTGERGYAIIVDERGDEGVYRVGDEVPGGATVRLIEARRVVLERDGRREALELPAGARTASADSPPQQPAGAGRDERTPGLGIGSLASMASRFALDPEALASRITILPVQGGGFRVRAGRDAAIFTQLGFHANDVVLAINGRPVDNRADVRAVFEDFRPGEPLAITVRRGARQLVLTPDLSNSGGAPLR